MIALLVILLNTLLLFLAYLSIRNKKVYDFRSELNEKCYEWSMRHLHEIGYNGVVDAYEWFMKRIPGYMRMLFSFKKLTMSEWFHEDAIRKLNS